MSVSLKEKLVFTKNISVMIKAGIALGEALKLEASQQRNPTFRKALFNIASDIEKGERFSSALEKYRNVFGVLYVNVIKMAEQSGSLDQSMEYLFEEMEDRLNFQRELTSALLYPIVVLSLVFIIGLAFVFFILPKITDVLLSFGGEPAQSVKIILAISNFAQNFGILVLVGLFLILVSIYFLYQAKIFESFFDRFFLGLPILGAIFSKINLSRFAKVFSTLLRSSVPVNRSLEISAGSLGNIVFKKALLNIIPYVNRGDPVSVYLDRKLFPALFVEMIEIGEKTGKIEQNLDYLSDFYKKEIKQSIGSIITLLEPALVLIIGVVILFFALAVFAPLYQTISSY